MAELAGGAPAPSSASPTPAANTPAAADAAPDIEPWKKAKHKVKVNGQEAEVGYDDLVTGYQLRQASDAKMRAAAEQQKQLQELWQKADPDTFFKSRQLNAEEWAEQLLLKKIKLQNMTPQQRQAFEIEQKEKAEREAFKREKEEWENQQREQITQQAVQKLDADIADAFKAIGMTPDPAFIDLMARRMEIDLQEDRVPDAKKALEWAINYVDQKTESRLKNLSAEQLRAILPKGTLDALRKQDVELIKSQSPLRGNKAQGTSTPPSQSKKPVKTSTDGWFKQMESKLSG